MLAVRHQDAREDRYHWKYARSQREQQAEAKETQYERPEAALEQFRNQRVFRLQLAARRRGRRLRAGRGPQEWRYARVGWRRRKRHARDFGFLFQRRIAHAEVGATLRYRL